MSSLTKDEYETRKRFLSDLKTLVKSEKEQIFRIVKTAGAAYSENSNGIFFDVVALNAATFKKLADFVTFCKEKAKEQEARVQEMNTLRHDLSDDREVEDAEKAANAMREAIATGIKLGTPIEEVYANLGIVGGVGSVGGVPV